jgi:hypothetical protein
MLAFVIAGAGLCYATVLEVDRLTRITTPKPPEVANDLIVRNAKDQKGRRASFRVLLFTDEFRWRMSSYESLESHLEPPVFTPEMKAVLDRAREIIVVGASSEEIVPGLSLEAGRKREEVRAGKRAGRIAMWVRQAVSKPIPIRKLNVGHHMPTENVADTSDQRRVVIILVLEREDGTNVDEALRSAMALESVNAPIFEALLTRYSLSAAKAFTWME